MHLQCTLKDAKSEPRPSVKARQTQSWSGLESILITIRRSHMYDNLLALGIEDLDKINGYTLSTEKDQDVLKIRFRPGKGHLFKRSAKFIYPRQHKIVTVDSGTRSRIHMTEISPTLRHVIAELDQISCH